MTALSMSDLQEDLVTFGVFVARYVVSVYLRCRRLWSPPETEQVTRTCHVTPRVLTDGDVVPSAVVLETWTRGSQTKSWVQYTGETIVDHSSPFDADVSARPPWSWIGYETASGDMIDLTTDLSPFVVHSNIVKPTLIHTMFPRSETGILKYLDAKTFEMKDLSSDGLVIGDSDDESIPPPPPSPTPELVSTGGGVCASTEDAGTVRVD